MNRIEHCKKCKKRKFDLKQGIVCMLTDEKPTFVDNCPDFENDELVKKHKGLELKPNEQRAKLLISLIWVILGLEIVALISSGLQYSLLQVVSNGGVITEGVADANDLREQVIAVLYLIVYITSGVAFIMWFRRAYFNLHQKVENLSYTEGWAAGCWFVPIINLFRPYQIMKELYQETKSRLLSKGLITEDGLLLNSLGLWWALWIVNGIIGRVASKYPSETIDDLIGGTVISLVSHIIGIPLAIITIKVVSNYSKVESLLKE